MISKPFLGVIVLHNVNKFSYPIDVAYVFIIKGTDFKNKVPVMKKVRFDPIIRLILIPDEQKAEFEQERLALAALYRLSINQCREKSTIKTSVHDAGCRSNFFRKDTFGQEDFKIFPRLDKH
jgi:hypothetical protein